MKEGFDVGLEMSGNGEAFRDMLANMCHGGKIALLGIPTSDLAIDWNTVIFNMLTIKGIYGREMYETWYLMQSMIQSGPGHQPGDHPPVPLHRVRASLRGDALRQFRQSDPELGGLNRLHSPQRRGGRRETREYLCVLRVSAVNHIASSG